MSNATKRRLAKERVQLEAKKKLNAQIHVMNAVATLTTDGTRSWRPKCPCDDCVRYGVRP